MDISQPTNQPDDSYYNHILQATENAYRDADDLVAKLAGAGLTVVVAVAGLADRASGVLVLSGFTFAAALLIALLSVRLSAAGLWNIAGAVAKGGVPNVDTWLFRAVKLLNWIAFVVLVLASFLAAVSVGEIGLN